MLDALFDFNLIWTEGSLRHASHMMLTDLGQRSSTVTGGQNGIFSPKLPLVLDALSDFDLIWTEESLRHAKHYILINLGQSLPKGHSRSNLLFFLNLNCFL